MANVRHFWAGGHFHRPPPLEAHPPRQHRSRMNEQEILRIVDKAVDTFDGNLDDLESAIGMLMLGRHYGWRVILLIHSPTTVRKYLKILGLKNLREVLPEVGVLAHRSNAWRLLDGTKNFWKVVRGQIGGIRSARVDKGSSDTP